MKNLFLKLFLFFILLIFGCSKAPLPPESDQNDNDFGSINVMTVNSENQGIDSATVFLNGDFVGYTPVLIDSIPFGVHTLRVHKSGYEIHSENIVIENNFIVNKEIILRKLPLNTGQLLMTVNQDSTQITITDSYNEIIEQTCSRELSLILDAGGYFIRCEKIGYELVLKAIVIKADSITVENIELQKLSDISLPQIVLVIPDSGKVNQPVLISWESTNADRVDIDYVENPGLNGKREIVFKSAGKHYIKAVAYNHAGQVSVIDSIFVTEVPNIPPAIKLEVSPKNAYVNEVVTLSWHSTNAIEVAVDYVSNPGLSGLWQVQFSQQGEVIIHAYAYGPGGEAQDVDTVYVVEKTKAPPTITIDVTPEQVAINQAVTISWKSENAFSVDVDFVPNAGLVGQWQTSFSSSGQVIINAYAYGEGGQVHDADTIYVKDNAFSPPTINVEATPKEVIVDQAVTISWQSRNAFSVDVDFVPQPGLSGQWQTSFSSPGEIIVNAIAYGRGGQAYDADTILVKGVAPPLLEFSVEPAEIEFSEPVYLTWSTNGYQVVIDQGLGARGPMGTEEIVFINPGLKIFTAVAYGQNNLTTTKKDSVLVKEPDQPQLPVITLSAVDSVEVEQPASIEWHSWNATAVDVDYVQNPGLNGKAEVVFYSPGERIITATAYNLAGQISVADTLIVVNAPVDLQVEKILVPSGAKVCAFHPDYPQVWDNAGEANIKVSGYYRVTAAAWYNSGDDQQNESFFITIIDKDGLEQKPEDPNAGDYKVVPDDPGPPHVAERDAGLFYLAEGRNIIRLHHYYTIADQFPQFIVNGPITGPESIQILYFILEYVK